jgi:hypothetical protein
MYLEMIQELLVWDPLADDHGSSDGIRHFWDFNNFAWHIL